MDKFDINNRRYIGSKTSLLNEIASAIGKHSHKKKIKIADLFGGTGVVANYFHEKGDTIIVNDILYSNFVAYKTFMSNGEFSISKIKKALENYNAIDSHKIDKNYFSETFGGKYFDEFDARKIGFIREDLEKNRNIYTEREYYAILTSLLYETDKIANTVGHFESFLKRKPVEKGVQLRLPNIKNIKNKNEIYCLDANKLVKEVTCDVAYIDPPYNARQYVNFYHVLENLALWQKPTDFEGNSMKFKRNHLKSDYSKSKAPDVFRDLINNLNAKLIIVSYNNTYNARSGASNNKISEEQLKEILETKGKVTRVDINYKFFNAGKTNFDNHKEYLYICEVNQ